MSVVSKLLERLGACQFLDCLSKSGLRQQLQSAYRARHSKATAMLIPATCLHWCCYICQRLRHGRPRHPDSATEDFLRSVWCGAVLPDILDRPMRVCLKLILGVISDTDRVWYRPTVRVGSRPSLFLLYIADQILLIQSHALCPYLYADNTQIYGFCRPSVSLELQNTITSCVDDVSRWMRSNRLQLNTA